MLAKIIEFLRRPFPSSNAFVDQVKESIGVGVFVFLFLFLLRPFGSHQLDTWTALWHTFIFGVITFLVSLSYDLVLQRFFKVEFDKPSWTFGKWLLSTIGLIILISIANIFYLSHGLGFYSFSITGLLYQVYATFLVGIFPIIFFGTVNLLTNQRKYVHIAEEIKMDRDLQETEKATIVILKHESGGDEVDLNMLQYAESLQNYVKLHLDSGKPITLRATLKSIESQLKPFHFIRTHRSYIVNKEKIAGVSGNAQGLKLKLKEVDMEVPVSRKYVAIVKSQL